MRIKVGLFIALLLSLVMATDVYAQTEPLRKRLGDSSVTMIQPENIRKKPDANDRVAYLPAFRVVEEPKSFVKIWKPRFTDKKAAKAFAKESGSKFKDILELDINGQKVPMMITYVKSSFKSGHVYKALFDAENSIVVIATVFDDAPITREEVLDAFKTIEINVTNPIGNFDDAPFTVDLIDPFEFVFASHNSLFIKSYPEIDERYSKPSIIVGYDDIFIYDGEPVIDSLQTAARHLFPVDGDNFYLTDYPDYPKLNIISEGYETIGPGQAYRIEATYKNRMSVQYVWDIKGKSEFDEYLFLFAMGDKDQLEPLVADITKIAASLKFKDVSEPVEQVAESSEVKTEAPPIPRVADQDHPLSACEVKRRKLTCDAMRSHSGFIFNTHLRDGGDTLQYQMSAMTTALRNEEFIDLFEQQVREHMQKAISLAAEIMGWDIEDTETAKMLDAANAALKTLIISPEELKPDPDSEDLMGRLGMQKVEFEGGRFFGNRSSIMNQYSLYLDKPGKKKRKK